ncbi:hypothetical protein [Adhaeribacter soli]|uniref:Porin family protein n=1 Tax=Adhaeribacter soli TaxID=2607655 RepID=A0A5N1J0I3_9BACT|nr:hypothetical protein [Adhaeribacter soli]KAA9333743.1 hypothetical protein F0P94_10885 [Adhaeribacter soli]
MEVRVSFFIKCILIFFACLSICIKGFSQELGGKTKDELLGPWEFTPKLGYVTQSASGLEVGLLYGRGLDIHNSLTYEIPSYGIATGGEILGYNGKVFFMPKLSAEFHSMAYGGRLDFSYFKVNKHQDLYLTPQFGLGITSFLSLLFGYNISLSGKNSDYLSPIKFSIYLNAPKHFSKGGKFWPG